MKEKEKKAALFNFKEFLPGWSLSFSICFMLFLYAPLELYVVNKDEFWFDIYKLFPIMLVLFSIAILLFTCILLFCYSIHRRLYQGAVIVLFVIFLTSYIQGNYLVYNFPPLDGTTIDWSKYTFEEMVSFVLWIVIVSLVLILIKFLHMQKFLQIVKFTGIGITLILFITFISIFIRNDGYKKKLDLCITKENEFSMSTDTNFIILLLDAVDARTLTELLEVKPEYKNVFSDFTYYPDMVCAYPFTKHSIPYIFSGDWYENDEPFEEYHVNAYKNSRFLAQLEKQEFNIGVYETELPLYDESICRFGNIKDGSGEFESIYALMRLELKLVGFKYAPFNLKKYCTFDISLLNNLKKQIDYSLYSASDLDFYNDINNTAFTYTDDKSFKFIHLEGAHVPFQYDKNMNVIENGTYEEKIEACITLTEAYLDKLKESEVYDNSVIILMADHGFNGNGGDLYAETMGRHNPMFLVKGINEKHDLYVSNAPVSFTDLQEAFMRLLNGSNSTEIFDWNESDQRERRYLFYIYLDDDHMVEFIQTDKADNMDTMVPTGKEFNY